MCKYSKYKNQNSVRHIWKTNYNTFRKKSSFYFYQIRKSFMHNTKIFFKKKFIINCCFYKNQVKYITSVCNFSGRYNSTQPYVLFKRHSFKYLLTLNWIPNFIKKYK